MSRPNIKHGVTVGAAAAINIELGWVPDMVILYNGNATEIVQIGFLQWILPFTSGGTIVVASGATLRGNTSAATAVVDTISISSGTLAAGSAVGIVSLRDGSLTGTFSSGETVTVTLVDGTTSADGFTTTASLNMVSNVAIITDAAATTTAATSITRYEGVAGSNAKGFTIGATLASAADVLRWAAFRGDVV